MKPPRWEAFGPEMPDRPPVIITCPARAPSPASAPPTDLLHDPIEEVVAGLDTPMRAIHWGGDAIPRF